MLCKLLFIFLSFFSSVVFADNLPIYVFPMDNYPQQVSAWVKNESSNKLLLDTKLQHQRFTYLKSRYYGTTDKEQSPWSAKFVKDVLEQSSNKNIYTRQKDNILRYENRNNLESKIGYGINFTPYTSQWNLKLRNNMQLEQFKDLNYRSSNRAIAVDNLEAFSTPTQDPWYFNYKYAGEGFPFNDNIISNIYLGTPLYVIGKSQDQQWMLVMNPQFIGWVKASGVAYVSNSFIKSWNSLANKSLISIITPGLSLVSRNNVLLNVAYAGTLLPVETKSTNGVFVFIPRREIDGVASIATVSISNNDAVEVPLLATPQNIVKLINKLMGRTYGWGGYMWYNDCSAEMQAIFTALGFYMPRNSSQQVNVGKIVDLSQYTPAARMSYMVKNAKSFMTLIQIPGHIMLYIGNAKVNNQVVPVVYEDKWGMRKNGENVRYVIGKSVMFPLMLKYPESPDFSSALNSKSFKLSIMDTSDYSYSASDDLY